MTITLTLALDVPVRPMDAKGLIRKYGVNIYQKRTNFKHKLNESFASEANVKVFLKFLASSFIKLERSGL